MSWIPLQIMPRERVAQGVRGVGEPLEPRLLGQLGNHGLDTPHGQWCTALAQEHGRLRRDDRERLHRGLDGLAGRRIEGHSAGLAPLAITNLHGPCPGAQTHIPVGQCRDFADPEARLEHQLDEGHIPWSQAMRGLGRSLDQRQDCTTRQRLRLLGGRLPHDPQMRRRIRGNPPVVMPPAKHEAEPLEAAVDGRWGMGLLMEPMRPKGGQVDGADLGETWWSALMDPCQPGPKSLHIGQRGPNGGWGKSTCGPMVTEGVEEDRIGAQHLGGYYTHNTPRHRARDFCVYYASTWTGSVWNIMYLPNWLGRARPGTRCLMHCRPPYRTRSIRRWRNRSAAQPPPRSPRISSSAAGTAWAPRGRIVCS